MTAITAFLENMHWGAVLQIIVIDILLGGDNAVVIALACRNLTGRARTQGIVWGTVGAIALRVLLISFAVALLDVPFLKLIGGLLLLWIGAKLLLPDSDAHGDIKPGDRLLSAIRTIIVADLVMSIDNVIAIAGAANGAPEAHRLALVIFGLVVSIPLIVWGSQLVLTLLTRFPAIVGAGAALLGWIAGGLIVDDPLFARWPALATPLAGYLASATGALGVLLAGMGMKRMRAAQ